MVKYSFAQDFISFSFELNLTNLYMRRKRVSLWWGPRTRSQINKHCTRIASKSKAKFLNSSSVVNSTAFPKAARGGITGHFLIAGSVDMRSLSAISQCNNATWKYQVRKHDDFPSRSFSNGDLRLIFLIPACQRAHPGRWLRSAREHRLTSQDCTRSCRPDNGRFEPLLSSRPSAVHRHCTCSWREGLHRDQVAI